MRIIRDYEYVDKSDTNAVAAIGNFDGVHLGHQAVLKKVHTIAKELNAPRGVITFEPHPRSYFAPDAPSFRLMSSSAKATRLEKLGVDKLYELNFNAALSKLNPEDFARNVLHNGLKLQHILVGEDFCFGKDRKGNVKTLKRLGTDLGFGVTSLELIKGEHGELSSTSIRNLLSQGKPREAAGQLGHWHRIEGPVIGGEQRGRVLGYPTANMELRDLHIPKLGVYAVLIDILDGPHKGSYKGASSLGVRPMFGQNSPNLETYIFDFSGDIYGAQISVAFVEYLRPELSFDSVEALVEQMDSDCENAKKNSFHIMTHKKNNDSTFSDKFWENKPLEKLNFKEWEALCDGCGKCCLNKIEDEETGQVFLTRIACRLFNDETCLCSDYKKRHEHVPECVKLTPCTIKQNAYWLPSTCAYKLLYEKKPLPAWHPLLTGQKETTHGSGVSVRGSTISEKSVNEDDWENYIITDPK